MKKILSVLFSLAFFAGGAAGFELTQQTFIAHRGESQDAPENSMPAFKLAVERGFGFECDLYLSTDGRVFSFHDKTLKRTAGLKIKTSEASWEETLSKLDVGSFKGKQWAGTRPSLLEDILPLARDGRKIYLEIKVGTEIVPYVKKILAGQSHANPGNVLFICFSEKVCAALKKAMPEYTVYWLCGAHYYEIEDGKKVYYPYTAKRIIDMLKKIKADGVDICWNSKIVTEEFIKQINAAGLEVHVWTVDKPEPALEALKRGAKTVTTNRAKKLLEECKAAAGK